MVDNIFKNIERILRWVYPGLLFFILLYITNRDFTIDIIFKDLGFPEYTSWGIILSITGIGALIYLLEQYVLNTFLLCIARKIGWDNTDKKDGYCEGKHFDSQAKIISDICVRENSTRYFYLQLGNLSCIS